MNKDRIRNFCVIAHIDHGKSTLADRILELTGAIERRKMREQLLDQMELERERGITIKLAPVRIDALIEGEKYILNLIDTPGHVDFGYEVSRSLAACEGAVLLVDAAQGVQAQTLANLYQAIAANLEIIPVLNKIDLPNADAEGVSAELAELLGIEVEKVLKVSAKTGQGVEELLAEIVSRVPSPKKGGRRTRALIFDSLYDDFQGVLAYVRVFGGGLAKGQKARLMATGQEFEVEEVGYLKPERRKSARLEDGEVGYVVSGLKQITSCQVGDTIASVGVTEALPGYEKIKPVVFAGFFPTEGDDFPELITALQKLKLHDAALSFETISSGALGRGLKVGFLGLLHLEIVQERLRREFDLKMVVTSPTVEYEVIIDGRRRIISSPDEFPDPSIQAEIFEPWANLDVITPAKYIGGVMEVARHFRAEFKETEYLAGGDRVILHYQIPLASLITDFYDQLKSVSAGYASMNYDILSKRRESDLVKLEVLIAGDSVPAFARIVPRDRAEKEGRRLIKRLKEVIPRQNFQIPLQATVGGHILARETIPAFRKDVTAKLYGGDVTRKRKLLEKQKRGKKKMGKIGKVDIPQEAFMKVLKREEK